MQIKSNHRQLNYLYFIHDIIPELFRDFFIFSIMEKTVVLPASVITARTGFLGMEKKITITSESITVEEKNGFIQTIYWKDFDRIRVGGKSIRGYAFYIGMHRLIVIRDIHANEIY